MLTVTLGLKVSKFFKSEQVEVHSSFLELVNVEFRLAVFNFLPTLYLVLFIILRASMSISAGMFETLFFFRVEQLPKKFLNCLRRATVLCNLE